MKEWGTDKIIAVGLMAAFVLTVIAMDAVAVMKGDMSVEGIAKELAIGLFSYMSRGLTGSSSPVGAQQGKTAEAMEKVAQTAERGEIVEVAGKAQKIVNVIDGIKEMPK